MSIRSNTPRVREQEERLEQETRLERDINEPQVTTVPVEQTPETVEEEYEEESPSVPPLHPRPVLLYIGPACASLILFSMVGVLVRVHLTRLFTYDGEPIYGLLWAQMVGCFIMGIATRTKGVLMRYSPALNLGVTTGLCGSITTFSSWQLLVFTQFFNTDRHSHTRFKNFLGGMSVLASTLACSMGALCLGQMIGCEVRLLYGVHLRRTKPEPDPLFRIDTTLLGGRPSSTRRGWIGWDEWRKVDLALGIVCIVAIAASVIVIALARSTRGVSIALLFGCVGTLLRWRLASLNRTSKRVERMLPRFMADLPLGTFVANVIGSAVLAIIHVLQTGAVIRPSTASCYVLTAVADGFCGCLTTVSTFAAELSVLESRRSMVYAIVSIVATQSFFILIAGIYFKTATVDYPVC
ncbi:hypothetical protein H4R20_002676 [Coemansia guatemalensis]|uniref:Fluoride ion transporter CrcB n=1 Tax=Coemansia guatemalensis TaxID=2761395 RepID=A0A9W8I221_9FUNG|nr:hypothetical protein H4R20_002676 [Coemansia guatemalensis]